MSFVALLAALMLQAAPHPHQPYEMPQGFTPPGASSCQMGCMQAMVACMNECSQKQKEPSKAYQKCSPKCSRSSAPCMRKCEPPDQKKRWKAKR
jgi:hypothetical protein